MRIDDLIKMLQKLQSEGKGDYKCIGNYCGASLEMDERDLDIVDESKEIFF